MKRYFIIFLSILLLNIAHAETIIKQPAKKGVTSFAIIVDDITYSKTAAAINAYKKAIEEDGLSTYIIINNWQHPDDVKQEIIALSKQQPPLEGVVFVGDIPIPMLRDAQHLTSAFKMDQEGRYSFRRSSVPSDRFYENFDLKFTFIKQDTSDQLLFYFSLDSDSPQFIDKEIYSGRIFPPVQDSTKYDQIRTYLERVVRQKNEPEKLSHVMTFAGHGYKSESLNVWESDLRVQREQFPGLFLPGGFVKNYFHSMSSDLKQTILDELQVKELDLAIFHAHGGVEAQYLLGNPPTPTIDSQVDAIKLFIRGKLREAKERNKSIEEVKQGFIERYNIPEQWFEDAFNDSLAREDSLCSAKVDLFAQDIEKIASQAELVIFDECFNGAFINAPYLAGKYVFGNGTTVAAIANSVNVLQDIWADEFYGLLDYGVRLGLFHRFNCYLESHIIGDPTFHFSNAQKLDLNRLITVDKDNVKKWKSLLKDERASVRNLALKMLAQYSKTNMEERFIALYSSEPSFIVRMQLFKSLAKTRSETFENFLFQSIDDPYELIRRKTVTLIGEIGRDVYVPALIKAIFTDPSRRVRFNAQSALSEIEFKDENKQKYIQELTNSIPVEIFNDYINEKPFSKTDWVEQEILPTIQNDSLKISKRLQAVRYFRNFRYHAAIPSLLEIAKDSTIDAEIRLAVLEALGWFTYSHRRADIIAACEGIINQHDAKQSVKAEALKTKNRLLTGANNPLTP